MPDDSSQPPAATDVDHEWWDGEGQLYLAWGILNPYGPTLYVLGAREEADGRRRVFMRGLHMLGGHTTYAPDAVAELPYQRIYDDAARIHDHLVQTDRHGLFHVVPSFLIANRGDDALGEIALRLLAGGAAVNEDWGRQVAYVRQFGVDFFGRTFAEIREYYEAELAEAGAMSQEEVESLKEIELRYGHLPQFRNARIPKSTPSPLTAELLDAWWQVVSARNHHVEALKVLQAMWETALPLVSGEHKDRLIPWEPVQRFLTRFNFTID